MPLPDDNPYCDRPKNVVLSKAMIDGIADSEPPGDKLDDLCATDLCHEAAGRLLRQNGKEKGSWRADAARGQLALITWNSVGKLYGRIE